MKILIVVGARPNFMKAAPLLTAIQKHNEKAAALCAAGNPQADERIEKVLVHTGQHYDEALSKSFFIDLNLPEPDIHLGVGSGSHAVQTAEIMRRFEEVLVREKPDVVVVVGDVNSTLACALAAARISYDSSSTRPLIAHIEAGLRSFDRSMPEEVNRILTDHLSDLLFVTEESGITNLQHEGISEANVHFAGNTMIDSLLAHKDAAETSTIVDQLGLQGHSRAGGSRNGACRYALLTLHRPSNVDDRTTFLSVLDGLKELSNSSPVIFPAHPRTRKRIAEFGLEHFFELKGGIHLETESHPVPPEKRIRLIEPLRYLDFLCLMKHAALVITDSGGIQEETTCLGVPCVTVRENTERPVTVTHGTNMIAGTTKDNIQDAVNLQMNRKINVRMPEKWDGKAGRRIVEAIVAEFQRTKSLVPGQRSHACLQVKS